MFVICEHKEDTVVKQPAAVGSDERGHEITKIWGASSKCLNLVKIYME
jgi:hypothetical protein